MKRIVTDLLIVFVLWLGSSSYLLAQSLTADRFLAGVSARPVGDQVEQDQFLKADMALNAAPPAEVQMELPSILQYALSGNEVHTRRYAVLFLLGIAMRPDGASLLSSSSQEISSLISDSNPGIQEGGITIMAYTGGATGENRQYYLSALKTAIQNPQTSQDRTAQMLVLLLSYEPKDPDVATSVLNFMHRDDLTVDTRRHLARSLSSFTIDLPDEINKAVVGELNDPDPTVRAAVLVGFAESTKTAFHTLAKSRVESMANDPQENPKVRELAQEAIAGKTHLSPNINEQPVPKDLPPLPPVQPMDH